MYRSSSHAVYSGLAGRSAYLELPGNPIDKYAMQLDPSDDRRAILRLLWDTTQKQQFCQLLEGTPADFVLEYANHPLRVKSPPCLELTFKGPKGRVKIWTVSKERGGSSAPRSR